jgi:hypothetical protein
MDKGNFLFEDLTSIERTRQVKQVIQQDERNKKVITGIIGSFVS